MRLGAMYGVSTFVISSRSVPARAACQTLPYVTILIGVRPIGVAGLPVSTVYVPRVTSCFYSGITYRGNGANIDGWYQGGAR